MDFEEKNFKNLNIDEKKVELYSSWFDLFVVLKSIALTKNPTMIVPSLDTLDGLKDSMLSEDEYLNEIYNNLDVIKELTAICLDEE